MFVFKAAIVGAGRMGAEIAQVIASAGVPVVLTDLDQQRLDSGIERARALTAGTLARLVASGRLTDAQAQARELETLTAITGSTSLAALADVDLVIEAVPEPLELKETVFAALDASTPGHAVLASITCRPTSTLWRQRPRGPSASSGCTSSPRRTLGRAPRRSSRSARPGFTATERRDEYARTRG